MTQIYVDMDGVLADFDAGYAAAFGSRPDKEKDDVDWALVRATPGFYLNLPPMGDMMVLWDRIARYQPIILTGVPQLVPEAQDDKLTWVKRWLPGALMIGTASRDKASFARPGDVLIDDWDRYRLLWEEAGGVWITHVDAIETGHRLTEIGL